MPTMAAKLPNPLLLTKLISLLLLLLLHLGCFTFTPKTDHNPIKKRRTKKTLSSSWSYIKRIFSPSKTPNTTLTSARTSHQSLACMIQTEAHLPDPPATAAATANKIQSPASEESDISTNHHLLFPMRNDIFPCTVCGEIFQKPHLLDQHLAIRHAVSELRDGESGKSIVNIIFKTGWTGKQRSPVIQRVLKIHNSAKIVSRFEEYREFVKAKAARNGAAGRRDERCVADGNELMRFHCSTFMCDLGRDGNSSVCGQQYCSVCGIIRSGFSPKLDGISTLSNSCRAHAAVPEEIEEEFGFMNVRRAMLVCRVVAGRVGCELDDEVAKEDGGVDSVVGRGGCGVHGRLDEEELLVFNPRAVLPCFVIVYTTV